MNDHNTCSHDWVMFYGPLLKCRLCGCQPMVSIGGESKPILPPPEQQSEATSK